MLGSHCQFQSAPRLVAAENVLPIVSEHINSVSIRSAACGRGELGLFDSLTSLEKVSIRSAACGRGEQYARNMTIFIQMFQSAPRLVAAENKPAGTSHMV